MIKAIWHGLKKRAAGEFFAKSLAAGLLVLTWQGSAQASLCGEKFETATPGANVDAVLTWTRTPDGVSGVVKLVPLDTAPTRSLPGLVVNSFGADNWAWREPAQREQKSDLPVEVTLFGSAGVTLGIFCGTVIVPRRRRDGKFLS